MKSRTRRVEGPDFTPSQSDVQDLLAAIAQIERKQQTQVTSQRLTPKDENHEPRSSPTRGVSKVLDSLANLCVSKENREVIATALRVNYKAGSIELIITSNTNVQNSTVAHLQEIWETLQQISTSRHERHQLDLLADTPPRTGEGAQVSKPCAKLVQLCLEFSFSRLQKRINKNFHHFSAIKVNNSNPEHPFLTVRKCVNVLENIFTRDEGARIGKPPHDDTKRWADLWACLKLTKGAIDKFLDDGGFSTEDIAATETFLGYESYLRKIESLINDIEVLVKLANSPKYKELFTFKFKVIPVRGPDSKTTSVPQTPKDWETVFEKALIFGNMYRPEDAEDYVINEEKIEEDIADMAKVTINRDLVIHCEVRILLYIFKTENKNPGIPRAYTYIGVSKLSCFGCRVFFEAFNRVHDTHFVAKGSHNKSYWPWQFPQSFPKSDRVLSLTYRFIVQRWVGSYEGYMVHQALLSPDSDSTSDSYIPYLTEDPIATMEMFKNMIAKG